MLTLQYPDIQFRLKEEDGQKLIFDEIRKLWLILTPEEWVRQHVVKYLALVKGYPTAYMALEKRIELNGLTKRFDLLVYDQNHQPWMMVECKALHIKLNQEVLYQVLRYNVSVPVSYLIITNGKDCSVFRKNGRKLESLDELPDFGA